MQPNFYQGSSHLRRNRRCPQVSVLLSDLFLRTALIQEALPCSHLVQGYLERRVSKLFVSKFRVYTDFTTRLLGTHHRRQRKLLNPAFSVTHLRNMTPIFHGIARQVISVSFFVRVSGLKFLSFVRVSIQLWRTVHRRSTSLIG